MVRDALMVGWDSDCTRRFLVARGDLEPVSQAQLIIWACEWEAEVEQGLTVNNFRTWLVARVKEEQEEEELERSR